MPQRSSSTGNLPPLPLSRSLWHQVAIELKLPPQETRIVELIHRGQQDKQIAEQLGLSVSTVRTYLKRAFDRTGAPDRLALVIRIFALTQEIAL